MTQWQIKLADQNGHLLVWQGEAVDGLDAEAQAQAAFPDATVKAGTEV